MDRRTILKPAALDPKRLPLGAFEGFVLSQVDGRLTLEEIAEITNLDLAEAIRIANLLVNLGAASPVDGDREPSGRPRQRDGRAERRADPREEPASHRPVAASSRPRRIDPRAEPTSVRPATAAGPVRSAPSAPDAPPPRASSTKTARAERRRSRRSLAMQQATPPAVPATTEDATCELDDATVAAIRALEAKLTTSDLYGLFDVDRFAEKKQIKRAYFAIAAKYHPDRFFKKKLGPMRAVVERVFQRMTEVHDILTDAARRAAYDQTLAPAPARPAPAVAPPPKKPTRPRLSNKAMKAARPSSAGKKLSSKLLAAKRPSTAKVRRAPTPPPVVASRTPERREQLRNAAIEMRAQARIDVLVAAAEKALRENDPVTAETNYRLALQHREDPFLRDKLESVEVAARIVRFEKHLVLGKAAEREHRWPDAAKSFLRAHDARPQAEAAARAANALRLAGGDLEHAADLAEAAVNLEPASVAYRVILIEVLVAAADLEDAAEELDDLSAIAPKDDRTKACAALVARLRRRPG